MKSSYNCEYKICPYFIKKNVTDNMTIYVDADACPVVDIIERISKKYALPLVLLCDTNHVLNSDYATVKTIGAGADAVDYALVNLCRSGDVVVTQDYGVAAMSLSKGAYVMHQSGMQFTNNNIDELLNQRYMSAKARRTSSKNHFKGPKKRTAEDDIAFEKAFDNLIVNIIG